MTKTDTAAEATFKQVGEALKPVVDPEIHISIVDLGLVYGAEFGESPKGRSVKVRMSLTSPACPYG
ncbi:MAG: iron-sulfur cluster assembly protein, partial [Elusimicrobia bacterium]|nr:iron-sulfur cluster assembly protein [Elusimicrobiota bacterium]